MLFLQAHDVSTAFAAKIYAAYGNAAIDTVKENPYKLADDIWGIGFKTADQIAARLNLGKESYVRCRSGLLYTLSQQADSGDTYSEREPLLKTASEMLEVDESILSMTLDHMIHTEDVKLDKIEQASAPTDGAVYLPPFYFAEVGVANRLRKLRNTPAQSVPVNISAIEKATGMQYDEIQADAIRSAASSKVMVLTGGPGTGKTTTTLGIIRTFASTDLKILLAAPTGRAAKRMTEATGMEAKTIHRLLEYKPPQGYERNDQNPLQGDVLIVDEASMIDQILMNSLLKALPDTMRLILVGDINQLPSIGAGNVLRDIIKSEEFKVVQLTRIFRQAQNSKIIMNAHAINNGSYPDLRNTSGTDFFWIDDAVPEHAAQEIVNLVKNRLPKFCHCSSDAIQVLTPMQRGAVGAVALNQMLQEAVHPDGEGLRRSGVLFKLNDKVMQMRNNYDKDVFNGDIGRVCSINMEDHELTVQFDDRQVTYDITELDELTLAYATTIHKAQGSEYPVVVMPILMTHFVMLQRNLVYTGITRAKKMLVLIGDKKALGYAIKNVTVDQRKSRLKERLKGGYCNGIQENN